MWIVQKRTTDNGVVSSMNIVKNSRPGMEKALRETANDILGQGFALAEQREDCFVFEKDGRKYELTAYEIQPLEKAGDVSVAVYHLEDDKYLEVMRDEIMGKAMVFVYDRNRPAAKIGAIRSDISFTDEEIIAASVSAVDDVLKKYEKK